MNGDERHRRFEEGVVSGPRRIDRTLTGVSCTDASESSSFSVSLGSDSTSEDNSLYDAVRFACRDARGVVVAFERKALRFCWAISPDRRLQSSPWSSVKILGSAGVTANENHCEVRWLAWTKCAFIS